ncbi:MAG: NAD(P)/FAD-dependent oxidoreductase [Anaerolineae bacterium]|nr:NAD(P)/FAD-dependent oxidoreductase [Anaerolineae bacterium]
MKTLMILGGGTAGTLIARKMYKELDKGTWKIVLVDQDPNHYYQPGYLFVPFGMYTAKHVVRPKKNFFPRGIDYITAEVERIDADNNRVTLTDGRQLYYNYLVIATGTDIHPQETEGMLGDGWRKNVHEFYTYEGTLALTEAVKNFKGGRIAVQITEMPIKCPVAPLEFAFLADWYFTKKKMRDKVEIVYATPLSGAFTKPVASQALADMLKRKNIQMEADFATMEVDSSANVLRSYDNREIPYDLLVTVPVNMGAAMIGRSGLGDDLNYVPTNKETLQSNRYPNIFVMGDATNLPTSKAGSVIHFQMETVAENMLAHMRNKPLEHHFDGHALCYIETGYSQAVMIDFSYDVEPLMGKYPLPVVGPFSLLKSTWINHLGKMGFYYMYYEMMLRGIDVPLPTRYSLVGKEKTPTLNLENERTPKNV